ncbi:MAG: hypothetical protein ACRDL3_06015 [Solirubrobacterales bacterium]
MRFAKRHLIAAAVAVLVLAAAVGVAVAQTGNGEEDATPAEQEAALEEVCGGSPSCVLFNSLADPAAGDSNENLVQVGDALAKWGKSASACPEAAAAFEAAGAPVDGFIGPCPDPAEAPSPADAKMLTDPPPRPGG